MIKDKRDFLNKAQKWLIYWNTKRIHYAKGFKKKGEKAIEVLKREGDNLTDEKLVYFPVMLIEDTLDYKTPSQIDLIQKTSFVYLETEKEDYSKLAQKGVNISIPSTNKFLVSLFYLTNIAIFCYVKSLDIKIIFF
ncbi:MAG: hypothetical protein KatS3mg090_0431 [Patescibacteria group bacterium]|nr:MAG: hypothetical protein KatS3mg090_0431 [Patescibacteria group bacterium]